MRGIRCNGTDKYVVNYQLYIEYTLCSILFTEWVKKGEWEMKMTRSPDEESNPQLQRVYN